MSELFGHWLDQPSKPMTKPRANRPLSGQKPLFDECTPELAIFGGQVRMQGVLFRPPESTGELTPKSNPSAEHPSARSPASKQ
jgi:hypothetical protein